MSSLDPFPKHPTTERPAALFHLFLAGVAAMGLWWHIVAAQRHWRDRD